MRRIRRLLPALVAPAVCIAVLVGTGVAAAGAATPLRSVTTWLPYWDMSAALTTTLDNAGVVGTASPYWYDIGGTSTVHDQPGASGAASVAAELKHKGVAVMPMVTEDADMASFAKILGSARQRAAMVRTLVRLASSPDYAGLDLDFEDLAIDHGRRAKLADAVAAGYPRLVGEACAALHAIQRSCAVTLMPRTSNGHAWHGDVAEWVYRYGALGKVADRVQVMAYDDHIPGDPAGPVAPLPWVKQVLAYSRAQVPSGKIELGVPTYGYSWSAAGDQTLTAQQATQLAAQVHVRIRWNAPAAEATFSYRQKGALHTVWFEDSAGDVVRAKLAAADHLAGIALWAAGYETPSLWPPLAQLR